MIQKSDLLKAFHLATILGYIITCAVACQDTQSNPVQPTAISTIQVAATETQPLPATSTKPAAIVEAEVQPLTVTNIPTNTPTHEPIVPPTATTMLLETVSSEPTATTAVVIPTLSSVITEESGYFIFGTYCGLCPPMHAYKIEGGKLYKETALDVSFPPHPLYTHGEFEEVLIHSAFLFDLPSQIPNELFQTSERFVGMPGAVDQGGYYVETNLGGTPQIWQIDTIKETTPTYMHEFIDALLAAVEIVNQEN